MTKSIPIHEKSGVTRVTGVTAFIHAAYGVTPAKSYGVTRVTNHYVRLIVVTRKIPISQCFMLQITMSGSLL